MTVQKTKGGVKNVPWAVAISRFYPAAILLVVLLPIAITGCGPRQQTRALYNEYHARIEHLLPENDTCLTQAHSLKELIRYEDLNSERTRNAIAPYIQMNLAGAISDQQFRAMVAPIRNAADQANLASVNRLSIQIGWTYAGVQYCKGYVSGSESPSVCRGAEHIWNDDAVGDYTHPENLGFIAYCLDNDFGY